MKYFIASDIHGSSIWCSRMLEAYRRERADRMLLLGDLLYHGPRNELPEGYAPKQVIEMLNAIHDEIMCVRGNCEAEVDQMVLLFPVMADYALISEGKRMIFVTHGHLFNNNSLPSLRQGDVLLHGHTHIPACEHLEHHTYCNPGSVSIPKAGSAHAYMTLENGLFIWKSMDGSENCRWQMD